MGHLLIFFLSFLQLSALVALQRGVIGKGDKSEACKHLQNVIQYQQERLDQVEEENVWPS